MRSFMRVFSVLLLVAWMGFIFYMSAQPAETSSQISGEVIEVIAEKFYPEFETLTETDKVEVVASFQSLARKSAHVAGFALLGIFAFLSFISYTKLRFFTRIFWAAAVGVVFAASDEFHQRFVSGRSCELRDFLLDTAGILGALIICSLFVKIIPPLRRKTAFSGRTKKMLNALNNELYEKLDNTVYDNRRLENRLSEQLQTIKKLENSLTEKSAQLTQIKSEDEETKMAPNKEIKLSEEMEYAASVIGEAVIEVTKVCNKLAVDNNGENTKELVNLALGRNEVLKAEILRILALPISFEEKQELILKEKHEAYDYFDSIKAQMC